MVRASSLSSAAHRPPLAPLLCTDSHCARVCVCACRRFQNRRQRSKPAAGPQGTRPAKWIELPASKRFKCEIAMKLETQLQQPSPLGQPLWAPQQLMPIMPSATPDVPATPATHQDPVQAVRELAVASVAKWAQQQRSEVRSW